MFQRADVLGPSCQELRWTAPETCPHGYLWSVMNEHCTRDPEGRAELLPGWWACDCLTHGGDDNGDVCAERPYTVTELRVALALAKLDGTL